MKTMLKQLLICSIIVLSANSINAQTDVKLLDFSVLPQHNSVETEGDSITLSIIFKINKANKAQTAQLWLGSEKNSYNVFIAKPVFKTDGAITTINYNSMSAAIKGYETGFSIKLGKVQFNSYKEALLFVETIDGKQTAKVYYSK